MLDFIVRHQEGLLLAIGTVVSAIMLSFAMASGSAPPAGTPFDSAWAVNIRYGFPPLQGKRFRRTRLRIPRAVHRRRIPPEAPRQSNRRLLLGGAAVAIWIAFKFVAALRPIPPAAGLQLPELIRTGPANTSLIIFLHGWNGDAVSTWQQFPQLAQRDQRIKGHDFLIINYPTYFLRRDLNITQLSEFIGRSLESDLHVFEHYRSVTVIAHSMGGLVAREIAIQHALRQTPGRFDRLIEIATPHNGADPARLAAALGISSEAAADLTRGSHFLSELRTHWMAFAAHPPTFCAGSPQDMVVREESALADCVDQLAYPQWGHTEMVKPSDTRDYRYVVPMRYIR